jgi:hypothetical protein
METDYSNYSGYSTHAPVNPDMAAGLAILGLGFLFLLLLILVIFYVYMAVCLIKIARKTKTEKAWMAWIPIANIILMLQIAKKPLWWLVLFFIPGANIVFTVLVWMEISKILGHPEWLGLLMIVPVATLVIPGYLAFSDASSPITPITPPIQPAA